MINGDFWTAVTSRQVLLLTHKLSPPQMAPSPAILVCGGAFVEGAVCRRQDG